MAGAPDIVRSGSVMDLADLDHSHRDRVGAKAANLGELIALGVRVPSGVCVTTDAFRRAVTPVLDGCGEELARLAGDDPSAVADLAARLRSSIAAVEVPAEVAEQIVGALERLGEGEAFAVRSSGTSEDLASASAAGQHDTVLDVVRADAVLRAVRTCWASLFTERAMTYRARNGIDQRRAEMAVVIQRMVAAEVSGVLFTADPVSGSRTTTIVEATAGAGEALVSGTVIPDTYAVRGGVVVEQNVAGERLLDDADLHELVALGRRIEDRFGHPQDIEWCRDVDGFSIVQSRPITTLFPVPEDADAERRVYVSVGHGQMMTDAMTPLGASVWQMASAAPTTVAGSRLFVDVTAQLRSPSARAGMLEVMGRSDPRVRDALETVLSTGWLSAVEGDDAPSAPAPPVAPTGESPDPAIVPEVTAAIDRSLADLEARAAAATGDRVTRLIRDDLSEGLVELRDPRSSRALMAAFEATWWLNDKLDAWLGEKDAADALSRSAPHNVTAEMGLALLDVADAFRPHPEAVAVLRDATDEHLFDDLAAIGAAAPAAALRGFLNRYGMRCVGEIDLGRDRWSERPTTLVSSILANVENCSSGERERRFRAGEQAAADAARDILDRLHRLPDGADKAAQAEAKIRQLRAFAGYREYPKYALINRFASYKRALLAEADRLVGEGVIDDRSDIFLLTFDEAEQTIRHRRADRDLIGRRRARLHADGMLRPPRVLTSDGEMFDGSYRRDEATPGALIGLGISRGAVEGRARVVHDLGDADLRPGDILVTTHTDPSWTPAFVNAGGLVTEVGGLTTHGAVVAREYGLVAVVGVEEAVTRIRDGQRIRLDGSRGTVELL